MYGIDTTTPADAQGELSFDAALPLVQGRCARLRRDAFAVEVPVAPPSDGRRAALAIGRALSLVNRALEHLDILSVLFGEVDCNETPTARIPNRNMEPPPGQDLAAERVEDLVARGRMLLRHHLRRLSLGAGAAHAPERLASARASVLTIRESFARVERALEDTDRAVPWPDSPSFMPAELARLRAAYAAFQGAVDPTVPPRDADVGSRIRLVAVGLARLIGGGPGPRLPREDRALLMIARSLVRDWLRHEDRAEDRVTSGLNLHRRFVALARRLLRINEHAALRAHDALLAREVLRDIPDDGDFAPFEGAYCVERLRPLTGRDDALDRLLRAAGPPPPARALREALTAVHGTLVLAGLPGEPAPSSAPPAPRRPAVETLRCPEAPRAPDHGLCGPARGRPLVQSRGLPRPASSTPPPIP